MLWVGFSRTECHLESSFAPIIICGRIFSPLILILKKILCEISMVISILLVWKLILREMKKFAQENINQLTELEFWPISLHFKHRMPPSPDKAEFDRLTIHHVYLFAEDYVSEQWSQQMFRFSFLNELLFIKYKIYYCVAKTFRF